MTNNEFIGASATIERSYVDTGLPYRSAVDAFEGTVGHLDPGVAAGLADRATPWPEVEAAMTQAGGPSGLMILGQFDQGAVASLNGRACLYVPFRVAIHAADGAEGATISFDRPSSSLGSLDQPELRAIGLMLDQKIDAVVQSLRR